MEIFDLIKYPLKLDKFELYNEQNERICICRFIQNYEKKYRLNGYFSKPIFCNYHSKIFGSMRYHSTITKEKCKELSNEVQMDKIVISNLPKTTDYSSEIDAKEERISLRHSPAAHVFTNDNVDDIEVGGIENWNSSPGGESA